MLTDIIAFEWRYHTRQISFTAAVLLFLAAGFTLAATGFGPDNVNVNSPYAILESTGLISLLAVFVVAVFCANAVVRDREYRMEEIVFTTSVEKLPFLLGRFIGSFLAAFTAFAASAAGMLAGRLMPWHDPARLGVVDPLDYLYALATIGLPNVLFAGVLLFAVATVSRSVLASYAASVFLYVLYFVAAALTNSPLMAASTPGATGSAVAALLDPFALSAFFEQTQYWTAADRNAQLVSLSGNFLLNRLIWIGASAAGFVAVHRIFSFRVSRSGATPSAAEVEPDAGRASYAPVASSPNVLQAFLSAVKVDARAVLGNRPFGALLVLWAALAGSEIVAEVAGGELGTAFSPTTALLAATIRQPLSLIGMVLLVYYSAELIWRERALRIAGIVDATPAPNAVFVLAKWVALSALVLVLTATAFLVGAIVQLANGWPLEPRLIASFAVVNALPLVLFAAVAVLVQTLTPQKYLGMILVLGFAVLAQRGDVIGIEHPLLRFASPPAMTWSAFNGFGHFASAWVWLMSYWTAVAGLALVVAIARWRRDTPRLLRGPAVMLALAASGIGAFVFYGTNVRNDYETAGEVLAWKAEYEKKFVRFATLPQPRVREVTAVVDLEHERRRYRVRGHYRLVNETGRPLDTIIVSVRRDAAVASISIARGAVRRDARFNQYLVRLDPPLAAGARTRLAFDVSYDYSAFSASPPDDTIVANGSYIMSFRSFPSIGYRASYEIEDPHQRRLHGLPPAGIQDEGSGEIAGGDWARFDVKVSTAPDQVVVAPGRLLGAWQQGGRRVFHFRSDEPIPNQFAIASARYAVARTRSGGVEIEVYHHPDHGANVPRMLRAAAESLRLFEERFGPYRHRHLRIAEVPLYWDFGGFAQPGVIFLQEQRAFQLDPRGAGRFDLLYRRVAHEVAHQWWGHRLVAADAPGATTLTESLTKYSELLALENEYGIEQVVTSLEAEHDLYLSGRTAETTAELPLARAGHQPYLYYRKGAVVMYALKDLLGARAVDGALRALLEKEGGPDRKPTTAHFLGELHAAAPSHRQLIDEWMNGVTVYDLALSSAVARRLSDGRYEVELQVDGRKNGGARLSEPIRVGVYAADGRTLLHRDRHQLQEGRTRLTLVVGGVPAYAVVDPFVSRIDRNRLDNSRPVEIR